MLDMLRAANKFVLPPGGFLNEALGREAIQPVTEIRLPFPAIALEWAAEFEGAPRHFVLCAEESEDGRAVNLWSGYVSPGTGYWALSPLLATARFTQLAVTASEIDEVLARLLAFVTVLQCSNVHVEPLQAKRPAGKKVKSALPFDSYWTLSIDLPSARGTPVSWGGAGRSPREHLRRGHIVRPVGRRPFWRNATVVCAGRGAGNVFKDYRVR